MKAEIETTGPRSSQAQLFPAPSLRVPVTAGNRDFLRWLRAAELSAWEAGCPGRFVGGDNYAQAIPRSSTHQQSRTLNHHSL